MFPKPEPTHGFLALLGAFLVYVALALVPVAVAVVAFRATTGWALVVFVCACLALLKPFVPLFRRLTPEAPGR